MGNLKSADQIEKEEMATANERLRARIDAVTKERDAARRDAAASLRHAEEVSRQFEILTEIDNIKPKPREWGKVRKSKGKYQATALTLMSDWHFDEVVNPNELIGPNGEPLNAYSRDIARKRLKVYSEGLVTVSKELCSGFAWDGLIAMLDGDLVSGNIHEELAETNDAVSVIETVETWIDPIIEVIKFWADEFGFVHIIGTVGNHGRRTRKPRAKGRVKDNFDWLLLRQVARYFEKDQRVTWHVPETADAYFDVYGHTHAVTHGDQARGGSGISGLLTPLSLLDHRKRKRDQAMVDYLGSGRVYSHLWVGHWHTRMEMGAVTINGSGKGIDEFSFGGNFGFEVPKQSFAAVTPEHNVTIQAPIYCNAGRKVEGW